MTVVKIEGPPYPKAQCHFPKEQLREIGWKGYREQRVRLNKLNADYCMMHARYYVDGVPMCARHAGQHVLDQLT